MPAATQTIPTALLQQVSEHIESHMGLHFPPARLADLERGLVQTARQADCPDVQAYVESLLTRNLHAGDLEILASSLTIGETHFFRDPRAFEFLETTLLPGLIARKRGESQRLRL
jgi:chemotaxis protein methyltransferase CheR